MAEEKKMTYEEMMSRLDDIIGILERNEATLDESIALYKEGIDLANKCDAKLSDVEKDVRFILNEQGKLEKYHEDNSGTDQ